MNKSIRSVATHASRLAALTALACVPCWAGEAPVTLAAITTSASQADAPVQNLGRIEAASGYDADVRRELVRFARHPDRGSASPRRLSGQVDVAFEVAGDGSLAQVGIAQSSSSNALDGEALRGVRRARFQPVPATAQADGLPRRYLVTFDYRY